MKKILSITTAAALIFSLSACSQGKTSSEATDSSESVSEAVSTSSESGLYSFEDDLGNSVSLERKPQKVAVLFSSYAQMWSEAGGSIAISVGDSVKRGFADENVILVSDSVGKTIDTEALIAAEPDFVICTADITGQKDTCELLNKDTDIPCAAFTVESFDDYLRVFKIMTDLTGDSEAYEEKGTKIGEQIDELIGKALISDSIPDILFIRAGSTADSTKAKTADNNFVCEMLKELGTHNIAEDAPVLLDGISMESIIEADPEYIFFSIMGDEEAGQEYIDSLLEQDEWKALSAVKNDKVYILPKELFQYKPNSKWFEAYEYLYNILSDKETAK